MVFKISDQRSVNVFSNLRSVICGLPSVICGLSFVICGLQSVVCSLQSANVRHRYVHWVNSRYSGHARGCCLVSVIAGFEIKSAINNIDNVCKARTTW